MRTRKQAKTWLPVDGTYELGTGLRINPTVQEQAYPRLHVLAAIIGIRRSSAYGRRIRETLAEIVMNRFRKMGLVDYEEGSGDSKAYVFAQIGQNRVG